MKRPRLVAAALLCTVALVWGQPPSAAQLPAAAAPVAQGANSVDRAGFQISGVVVNAENHAPLGQARVTVRLAGTDSVSRTVTTGDDGRFLFERLRAGKYALSAERRGFAPQGYQQHEGQFSTAIVVGPELDATHLVFRIAPDASLSGRVTDDRNEPVRSARVMLIHELMVEGRMGKRIVGMTSTDDQGHYHFAHLKPGAYYLAVSARPWYAQPRFIGRMRFRDGSGFDSSGGPLDADSGNSALDVAYPLTFYPDVTDAAAASAIMLHAGNRASADIMLRAVPALHVRLRNATADEERQQFATAMLAQVIFDGIEVPVQTTTTGMGGNANLVSGIAPGHYLMRMNPNGRRFRRMESQAGDDQEEQQPARVRELDLVADTELDASEVPAAAMVSGTVKLANGQAPSKPPEIELRRGAMRRTFSARATASGEFSFPLGFAAGSYQVLMSSGEGMFIRGVTATGAKMTGRMLHISGSDAVKLAVVVGAGAGKIEGVALRDGKPQSGVMILLVPHDAENNLPLFRRDQSDTDGTFTLANVLPGDYTLLALENGWDLQWGDAETLKPFLAGGEVVVVEAKGSYNVRVKVQ